MGIRKHVPVDEFLVVWSEQGDQLLYCGTGQQRGGVAGSAAAQFFPDHAGGVRVQPEPAELLCQPHLVEPQLEGLSQDIPEKVALEDLVRIGDLVQCDLAGPENVFAEILGRPDDLPLDVGLLEINHYRVPV